MKKFKYQMHTHTSPCSDCSRMYPEELAKALYDGGYSGCVVTNHFLHGNSGIDRSLSWEDFVRQYELDYLECKRHAEKYGLDIIFGLEEGVGEGLEILCYGITPEFLYDHPELSRRDAELWHNALNSCGAICVQAHPFREADHIPVPKLLPIDYIDGIEVYNAGNSYENNASAAETFKNNPGFIAVSGADTHHPHTVCLGGIQTEKRITNEKELVEVLKSGEYTLIEE